MKNKHQAEIQKFKTLDRRQKIVYIFDYYKVQIILIILVLAALAGVIWHLLFTNQKAVMNLCIVNEEINTERDEKLAGYLSEYLEIDTRKEKISVDSNYNIAYIFNDDTNRAVDAGGAEVSDFSTYEKYFLNIDNGAIDAAIIPEGFLEYCTSLDLYYEDLNQVLSDEQLEKYKDRLCFCTDETGKTYVAGLYMDETVFDAAFFAADQGEKTIKALGRQVLVFPKNAKNKMYQGKTAECLLCIQK